MIAEITYNNVKYRIDLSKPIDISIPLRASKDNVTAWYVDPPRIEPVRNGDWIGEVSQGGSVNFRNIFFNPHGHGTHTECVGHISKEFISLNQTMKQFFFPATLITITPEKKENGDHVITKNQIAALLRDDISEALIIRTLPNDDSKCSRQYSNTNFPYLDHESAKWMCENKIKHLLLDLPSVDRENDDGKLLAHHAFWSYPQSVQHDCTITELIYVKSDIPDGKYFLNIQIASFENDASPSKPLLFQILNSK